MSDESHGLEKEAAVFGRYLLKRPLNNEALRLYMHAVRFNPGRTSARDKKLLAFAVKHPWSLGFIDGGLVFADANSEVRRRLYVMLSVLETNPEYADHFLPRARAGWYVVVIGLSGLRGVVRAAFGLALIKVVGR